MKMYGHLLCQHYGKLVMWCIPFRNYTLVFPIQMFFDLPSNGTNYCLPVIEIMVNRCSLTNFERQE